MAQRPLVARIKATMIYTLVENYKRHGVLVEPYLRDLLAPPANLDRRADHRHPPPASIAAARRRKPDAA